MTAALFALAAIAQSVAPVDTAVGSDAIISEQYQAYSRQLDACLINAAEHIARNEPNPISRYNAYGQACLAERAALITQFMRDNAGAGSDLAATEVRWQLFESAARRADDRARIWVPRFLDPGPARIEPPMVTVIDAQD